MYNYFQHRKQLHASQESIKAHESQPKIQLRSKALRNSLAQKYERRVDHFITNIAKELVREERKTINPSEFIHKFIRSRNESVTEEQEFELRTAYAFRRLDDSPTRIRRNLNSSWALGHSNKADTSPSRPLTRPITASNKGVASRPASAGLRKTHFKGVLARVVCKSGEASSRQDLEVYPHTTQHQKPPLPAPLDLSTSLMARDVLQTCNIIEPAANNPFLKIGQGRLMSNPRIPTKTVYSQLFKSQSQMPS